MSVMADPDQDFKFINPVALKGLTEQRRKQDDQLVERIRDGILSLEESWTQQMTSITRNELMNQLAPLKRDIQMFKTIWEELHVVRLSVQELQISQNQRAWVGFYGLTALAVMSFTILWFIIHAHG